MTSEILLSPKDDQLGSDPQVVVESTKDTESRRKPSGPASDMSRCEYDSTEDHELSGSMLSQERRGRAIMSLLLWSPEMRTG
jgi:hypothetical protein